jgi:rhomboid protease GluP
METKTTIVQNWFTLAPHPLRWVTAWCLILVVYGMSLLHWEHVVGFAASGESVFLRGEWWRAWSALFVHADLSHLLANSLLFFFLTYLLAGRFGVGVPLVGFAVCGVMNLIVLQSLPPLTKLVGASGVVHWMAGAWFTLYLLIDRREKWRTRFGSVLFLLLMLFLPEAYEPRVSYLSHFLGFLFGILSALGYYWLRRETIESYEVRVTTITPPPDFDWSGEEV